MRLKDPLIISRSINKGLRVISRSETPCPTMEGEKMTRGFRLCCSQGASTVVTNVMVLFPSPSKTRAQDASQEVRSGRSNTQEGGSSREATNYLLVRVLTGLTGLDNFGILVVFSLMLELLQRVHR